MTRLKNAALTWLLALSVTGCVNSINKTLSPPSDTRWITVEVKNPSPYTRPVPLTVAYISYHCKKGRINGFDGSWEEKSAYNVKKVPLEQQGSSDIWQAKVAMEGGGRCKWVLSKVKLGIEYADATHLGKDLVPGTAAGALIGFSGDAVRAGGFTFIKGDLSISPKYFPHIIEWNIMKQEKNLYLLGKESPYKYHVTDAKKISFSPVIDEHKVIRTVEPPKKEKGLEARIIYPDGSVVSDGTVFPDYDKLDKMIVK